jgi:hypothetical protein
MASPPAAPPAASYSVGAWCELSAACAAPRHVVDALVLEALVLVPSGAGGGSRAACAFAREALGARGAAAAEPALRRAREREAVLAAARRGDVEGCVAACERVALGALARRPALLFRLRLHALVALIAAGRVGDAIKYAQAELAPLAEAAPELRRKLEEALSLLLFEDKRASPVGHLLDPAQLEATSRALNAAVLEEQGLGSEPRLAALLSRARANDARAAELYPALLRGAADAAHARAR